MKKRLLITSIVMMLVVAVALSTATYAWFTANTSVKADAVVLTASTMEGDAIMISRAADNSALSDTIILAVADTTKLYPATPNAADALTAAADGKFINLEVDGSNSAKSINKNANSSGNVSYYTDTFYVYNKGFKDVTLNPVVSIYFNSANGASSDAANSVRIAIIEEQGSWVSNALTFGSATLKNIYEFDPSEGKTTALALDTTKYVAATAYAAETQYYELIDGVYKTIEIAGESAFTSATTGANPKTLYKTDGVIATTDKNTAKPGALTGYGAVTTVQAPAPVGSVYTQSDALSYTAADYTKVKAAASGTYIANKYTVVVWLEGWDEQCTNAMSAGIFKIGLTFAKASA